ncbi:MAG: VOC family protein [Flavobacteriales bacterium]
MNSVTGITPIPKGYHCLSPFLVLKDIAGFLDFLRNALDVQVVRTVAEKDGSVTYAEVRLGDSHLLMREPMGQHEPMPASLYFYVPQCDAVYKHVLAAGATSISEPTDRFYGDRNAGVRDKWGNIWWFATHIEDVNQAELERRNQEKHIANDR